jgi:hypothetical protein
MDEVAFPTFDDNEVPYPVFELASCPVFKRDGTKVMDWDPKTERFYPCGKYVEAVEMANSRSRKGASFYYQPLPPELSKLAREYYLTEANWLGFREEGKEGNLRVRNPMKECSLAGPFLQGVLIATGYRRLVVGDYGAYVEMLPEQVKLENLREKWPKLENEKHNLRQKTPGHSRHKMKYIWMIPVDGPEIKVYAQQGRVQYADYLPGMYYVSPYDVRPTWKITND